MASKACLDGKNDKNNSQCQNSSLVFKFNDNFIRGFHWCHTPFKREACSTHILYSTHQSLKPKATYFKQIGKEIQAIFNHVAVTDPELPRGGTNLLIDQFFPENCMKIKKFWPGGARPLRPTIQIRHCVAGTVVQNEINPYSAKESCFLRFFSKTLLRMVTSSFTSLVHHTLTSAFIITHTH